MSFLHEKKGICTGMMTENMCKFDPILIAKQRTTQRKRFTSVFISFCFEEYMMYTFCCENTLAMLSSGIELQVSQNFISISEPSASAFILQIVSWTCFMEGWKMHKQTPLHRLRLWWRRASYILHLSAVCGKSKTVSCFMCYKWNLWL